MLPRRTMIAVALAAGLAGSIASPAGATHTFRWEPTTTKFFMRNAPPPGTPSCPGDPFLSTTAGSGEPACGYIGGLPFGELNHAGAPVGSTIITHTTRDGTPQYLDPSRDVSGNVRIVATAQTNRMAAGQIIVDLTLRGRRTSGQTVVLGTYQGEAIVNPTNSAETDFPFTMDLGGLGGLDKQSFTELTMVVDIHGWHVLTGYFRLNGQSWFDLPAWLKIPIPH